MEYMSKVWRKFNSNVSPFKNHLHVCRLYGKHSVNEKVLKFVTNATEHPTNSFGEVED